MQSRDCRVCRELILITAVWGSTLGKAANRIMTRPPLPGARDAAWLHAKAAQCHRLAKGVMTRPDVAEQLIALGNAYEAEADAREAEVKAGSACPHGSLRARAC